MSKGTKDDIISVASSSSERHPQSENFVKIVSKLCYTGLAITVLVVLFQVFKLVFYWKNHGDTEIFTWFNNAQIFGAGFMTCAGVLGVRKIIDSWKDK